MKFYRQLFAAVCALAMAPAFAGAQTLTLFGELRAKIDAGLAEVTEDLFIEGIAFNPAGYGNIAQSIQRYHSSTSNKPNSRTTYIESTDASFGFKVDGSSSKFYKKIQIGDCIVANLKGCTLEKTPGGMYLIHGFGQENVLRKKCLGPEGVPQKSRRIADLTEQDLCTFVTLEDCEFVFKDGAYINIYETYAQSSSINKIAQPNGMMDGWASLLCDKDGRTIYFVSNTACNWRRRGDGVYQGCGKVQGVILNEEYPRYSAFPIGYQVRCWDHKYLKFKNPSAWRTVAEWTWGDAAAEFDTDQGRRKVLSGARIKADSGQGFISCEVDADVTRGDDYNNPKVEKETDQGSRGEKGIFHRGAMKISCPSCAWWDFERNCGKGIVVETSTYGIKGRNLIFAFTFGAGDRNPNHSSGFPCYWEVQYSFDGVHFQPCSQEISLRSIPWWYGRDIRGERYPGSAVGGLGFTDHLVNLPPVCFNKKRLFIRVVPTRRNAATYDFSDNDKAAIRPGYKVHSVVSFGTITLRYD